MSSIWVDLLGTETRYYDANGIRTRVIEAGHGFPLVLLHGSGGHAEAYAHNIVPLARKYHVIAADYLGSGMTEYPPATPSLDDRVAHIIGLLDAMGLDQVCLAGESFGAVIAFAAARKHPERIHSIIAIVGGIFDVGTSEGSIEQYDNAVARLIDRQRAFLADPSRDNVRQRLNWLFHRPERDITEELVDLRYKLYQLDSNKRSIEDLTNMILQERHARHANVPHEERTDPLKPLRPQELAAIPMPTLFIWSDHNPSVSAETAELAANCMPNARFALMKDAAHWPQWEHPEEFNRLVEEFLDPLS